MPDWTGDDYPLKVLLEDEVNIKCTREGELYSYEGDVVINNLFMSPKIYYHCIYKQPGEEITTSNLYFKQAYEIFVLRLGEDLILKEFVTEIEEVL